MLNVVDESGNNAVIVAIDNFHSGEINVRILHTIADKSSEITIQARLEGSNDVIALLMVVDALKRNGYNRINLFMPYVCYGRQDRICNVGEAFSLGVFADLINNLGFSSVHILEPHSDVQTALIKNSVIIDNIPFIKHGLNSFGYNNGEGDNLIMVSPDSGATKRVQKLADYFNLPLVQATKSRDLITREISRVNVFGGAIYGKDCVVVDDIISGGSTFINLAKILEEQGVRNLYLIAPHCEGEYGLNRVLDYYDKIIITNSMKDFSEINNNRIIVWDLFNVKRITKI